MHRKSSSGSYANSMADGDYDYASRLMRVDSIGLVMIFPRLERLAPRGMAEKKPGFPP